MSKTRWIVISWLLLLVPTLLLGVGALSLLQNEEARLAASSRATAADRLSAIAGNIDLAVAEVEDGLQETLRELPQDNLPEQLDAWKRGNPLVRNVFIWQRGQGLTYPDPERPASDEEAAFVRRYLPLFSNQAGWQEPLRDVAASPKSASVSNVLAERKELRLLAKQTPAPAAADVAAEPVGSAPAPAKAQTAGASGWRSWYADDQLHLLGWFAPQGENLRYGVEVEMMALLSRLMANLPASPPAETAYALLDGNGAVFHQVGGFEITAGATPLAATPVTSLPHWQVAAYGTAEGETGGGLLLVGSLLVGTFTVAILLGGSLLLWQAYRHQRDARQKTSFVSNVSHELKTPLTTIRMYAELLGEGRISEPDKQRRYLQTIIKESQRLTRLVGNVLDFSRLEQGRRQYRHDPLDLAELLQQLLEGQQVRLAEAGLVLDWERPIQQLPLQSDRDALEQILLNLLDNAIKYAAEGERLQVMLKSEGKTVLVQIRDFGPGIPAAHRQRVFEKFHRVDESLTARSQGSGLGLSIARQLAEGLGGTLSHVVPADGGSCFELRLPTVRG